LNPFFISFASIHESNYNFFNVIYQIFLVLPKLNSTFDFIKSSWNWDGKIFGIICGIIFYFIFRNYFRENDFFTFKQNKENFKPALIGAISIVLLATTELVKQISLMPFIIYHFVKVILTLWISRTYAIIAIFLPFTVSTVVMAIMIR
jgi:hypothetical protein